MMEAARGVRLIDGPHWRGLMTVLAEGRGEREGWGVATVPSAMRPGPEAGIPERGPKTAYTVSTPKLGRPRALVIPRGG